MEDGLISPSQEGVPQGGPLSPILSNIYLDTFDKELEERGLRFVRYVDDCNIFVKSGMAANRVMKSITSWLEKESCGICTVNEIIHLVIVTIDDVIDILTTYEPDIKVIHS